MKKAIYLVLAFIMFAPFAMGADKIDILKNNGSIEINNMPFKNNCIGNCFVSYTEKQPYKRILRCKVCQETENRDIAGEWVDTEMPEKVWTLFDKLFYTKYGTYSPWHNNPSPIVKNTNEIAKIQADKKRNLAIAIAECKRTGGVYNIKTGGCYINMTAGMNAKEKEDYLRAKDFEDDYKNYLKHKSGTSY